jgi:hypothetical protein
MRYSLITHTHTHTRARAHFQCCVILSETKSNQVCSSVAVFRCVKRRRRYSSYTYSNTCAALFSTHHQTDQQLLTANDKTQSRRFCHDLAPLDLRRCSQGPKVRSNTQLQCSSHVERTATFEMSTSTKYAPPGFTTRRALMPRKHSMKRSRFLSSSVQSSRKYAVDCDVASNALASASCNGVHTV